MIKKDEKTINEQIVDYYDLCDRSYQHWGVDDAYSMHYGFWRKRGIDHRQALIELNVYLSKKLQIKPGDRLLDAGCGVGASSLWLAQNYDIEIVGITLSPKQCRKANALAEKLNLSNRVKFFTRDYTDTHFKDDSFDIVWAVESVCHAKNKHEFINEASRVLKKDGKLILADGFQAEKLTPVGNYFLRSWLKNWVLPNLARAFDFRGQLEKDGFTRIDFEDATNDVNRSALDIFKRGVLGLPVYILKRKNMVQIKHVKGCVDQYLALKNKAWIYGIFYAQK